MYCLIFFVHVSFDSSAWGNIWHPTLEFEQNWKLFCQATCFFAVKHTNLPLSYQIRRDRHWFVVHQMSLVASECPNHFWRKKDRNPRMKHLTRCHQQEKQGKSPETGLTLVWLQVGVWRQWFHGCPATWVSREAAWAERISFGGIAWKRINSSRPRGIFIWIPFLVAP